MLDRIKLSNFKCFEQLDLRCAPLNLLCGLNGMGKSSVLQALLVLRQSFESGELRRGRLVLGGGRADLGTGLDVLFDGAERDTVGFSIQGDDSRETWEMFFAYSRIADELSAVLEGQHSPDLATVELFNDQFKLGEDFKYDCVPSEWQKTPPFGGFLIYISADRVGPRKLYPLSYMLSRQNEFGVSSEYAWSYFNDHQNDLLKVDDPRCINPESRQLRDLVDLWLQEVSPGAHMELEAVTAADSIIAGFSFDRPGDVASRRYRATNVGFGLSYTFPVILALLAPAGTLCLIENPESHLHPRGQTKLGELAARASRAGVQVFIETHSDHFMDGVRIAVRDGLIAPEEAAFHYFERDGHRSVVTSPKLDEDGRLSQWPAGFFDQHAENMMKLLGPR